MKRSNKELDNILDRVTADIRNEQTDASVVKTAADRVWSRLSNEQAATEPQAVQAEHIRGCADFQTLIPSYLQGSLTSARVLLFEDHTRECVPCRKALKQARTGAVAAAIYPGAQKAASARPVWVKWAAAATLIIALGWIASPWLGRFGPSLESVHATVHAMTGPVYLVSNASTELVGVGKEITADERIRTAKDAGAVVRLSDGSLIEMKERSEFSITESAKGVTIHLERGNIIVQAAKQRSRHLFVNTNDCLVSVTGTIFSVNNGTKGSRVSVIEGEVHVDHSGEKDVLHPGDQVTTRAALESVPVADEIAWSQDRERYTKMLAEVAALRKELDEKVARPGVRYSTRLLDLMPEGTVLYAALPNLTETLAESHRIIQERINENRDLREWWESEQTSSKGKPGLDMVINRVREFGNHLGSEIVVSAEMGKSGDPDGLLVLAELKDPASFRSYLGQQVETLNSLSKKGGVRILDDPLSVTAQPDAEKTGESVFVWVHDDLLAATPHLATLQRLATNLKSPGANRFGATSFHSRIADVYKDGAGLIVAADLEKIISHSMRKDSKSSSDARQSEVYKQLGVSSLRHFVLELKEKQGKPHNSAVLTFDDRRSGLASWLAEPGPMGALEFISPDANVVAAFVVKEPAALVDDLLGALRTIDPTLWQHLKDAEAEHGIDIRKDFAEPLGGEFAFAIDGPILPSPSWKMVFEVYDSAHLQSTFERVVEKLNGWARAEGKNGFGWERTEAGGQTYYTLKSLDYGLELNYTYVNGYFIAAPSRALVDRAVKYRETGYTLLHSPKFMAALPEDKNTNFSAIFYHNLNSVLEPLARQMPEQGSEGKRGAFNKLATAGPVLAYAYSYGDRIVFSAGGENGPFGLTPGSLLGLPAAFGLQHIIGESMR